ncbi:MAG: hypothetical protein HY617_01335 [Candidatus Sungbacteria bacterium]|nr:hypothetical protein [Candidatus Sungbacteria bacterium]
MTTLNSQIKVLRVVYAGIYEDYVEVEVTFPLPISSAQDCQKEVKIYSISVEDCGKRIIRMKQSPFPIGLPPSSHDGYIPLEFEEEIKLQMRGL